MPLFAVIMFLYKPWRLLFIKLSPLAALPAFILTIYCEPNVSVYIEWFFLNAQFAFDPTAKTFLFFTSLIWMMAGFYATTYIDESDYKASFFVYYLTAMTGNLGLILAQDVMSFYFLFALMSFASYGLVVHSRTRPAYFAGKVYIYLVVIGEVLLFSGLLLAAQAANSIYFADFSSFVLGSSMRDYILFLLLLGFGVKAGMFPVHVWLPLAHPVAPTPASAILSGAMINAGLIGWLRVFPLGDIALPQWGILIIILGVVAAIGAALLGCVQKAVKAVLAYSSISQMGVMTMLLGVGMVVPEMWKKYWVILMIYATHHAIAKAALFLSVGTASMHIKSRWLSLMHKLALIIPALAIAGAPFTSGAFSKGLLKYAIEALKYDYAWAFSLKWAIIVSAVTTTLIMARFLWLVWPRQKQEPEDHHASVSMYYAWGVMVMIVLVMPGIIHMQGFLPVAYKPELYFVKWSNVWPLMLGSILAGGVIKSRFTMHRQIPQGDIIVFYTAVLSKIQKYVLAVIDRIIRMRAAVDGVMMRVRRIFVLPTDKMDAIAHQFEVWKFFGLLFVLLFIVFLTLNLNHI